MGGRGLELRAGFADHVDTQIFVRFAHSVIARSEATKQSRSSTGEIATLSR